MTAPRPLRFLDLTLYTVAMTLSVRWAAVAAAAGPVSIGLWLAAMLGFMAPLVLATAELTSRFPGSGGLYVWVRDSFGPFAGFLCGWLYWTCNLPFFSGLLVFIVNALGLAAGGKTQAALGTPGVFLPVAIALSLAVGAAHLRGLGAGKWLSNFGAAASCGLMGLLIVAGGALALTRGPATDFAHASYALPLNAGGAILWSTMVFAFGGPEALAFLKDDVEGGVRQILRVLAVVGALLVAVYSLATLGVLSILAPREVSNLSGVPQAIQVSLQRLGLGALAPAALVVLGLALLGAYSAWFGVAARLPFAAGVDHVLPRAFARRDPRTGAPTAAIWVQMAVVVVLTLLSEAGSNLKAGYDFLVSMSVLSYTLPFVFLFAVFLRAQSRPGPEGAWRMPGGRGAGVAVGVVGLLVTLSAVACTLVPSPDAPDKAAAVLKLVVASGVLIASGAACYGLSKLRRPAPLAETAP